MRVVALLLGMCATAVGAPASTQDPVDVAIARGQAWLLARQAAPGRWETEAQRKGNKHDPEGMQGSTWGGYTALATYALLASGKSAQEKDLEAAIKFLKTADITGPYAVGVRAQVWALLPRSAETQKLLKQDSEILLRTLNTRGRAAGLWDYQDPSPNGTYIDHSASQYGVLGLWAATLGGVEIDTKLWTTFDAVWKKHQYSNGGWSYDGDANAAAEVTHTMTAAGVATLYITQEYVAAGRGLNCTDAPPDPHLERGMQWLTQHFEVLDNAYYWYGVERIGATSGQKYFGDKDWYAIGRAELLRSQESDGSWNTRTKGGPSQFPDTCFALLFLSRGRAPLVMNKLQYGNTDWNQRPRDAANITRWIGRQGERYLGWQIVNLHGDAQDLLDAPILYVSGTRKLAFQPAEVAKLRQFVEDGGLILGNANCGKEEFAKSFRQLGTELFPSYEFRELPSSHPILSGQQFRFENMKPPAGIQGLSNGVREFMLLLPSADPARAWQQRANRSKESDFQIGANIFLYATDKRWGRLKGQTHVVKDAGVTPTRTIRIARLQVGSNWDPEPGGWRRLALVMKNEHKIAIEVIPVKLAAGSLTSMPPPPRIAHLTGTLPIILDGNQREELKRFVVAGGTLVVDAAGGSSTFAESAEKQLAATFGQSVADQLENPIPPGDPLFANPNAPIKKVAYRRSAMEKLTGGLQGPRLRGITFGKRLGVIFSREDLGTGLVGQAVDGVVGYDPPSAMALMRNIILYADQAADHTPDGLN